MRDSKSEITTIIHKFHDLIENEEWDRLPKEVFVDEIYVDVTSAGIDKIRVKAPEYCKTLENFLKQRNLRKKLVVENNIYIDLESEEEASAIVYSSGKHFQREAPHGEVNNFTGIYHFRFRIHNETWRMYCLRYELKEFNLLIE